MSDKPYKEFQQMYAELIKDHEDDLSKAEWVLKSSIIDGAMTYFTEASFPLIYPGKSYAVAIVYATKIEEWYGIPMRAVLNDPDLLPDDDHFVTYEHSPMVYEALISRLNEMPDWLNQGWVPKTVEYARLECTEQGIQDTMAKLGLV